MMARKAGESLACMGQGQQKGKGGSLVNGSRRR